MKTKHKPMTKRHFFYIVHVINAHFGGYKPLTREQYIAVCNRIGV